jgi:hypothetical protein
MNEQHVEPTALLTPKEAGLRLLEAASLAFYRSEGLQGLAPVKHSGQPMYRPADVNGFIQQHLKVA